MSRNALPLSLVLLSLTLAVSPGVASFGMLGSARTSAFGLMGAEPASSIGRVAARSSTSIGDFTFTGVAPRIITPNGDGWNDKAVFSFSNPELLPVSGKIYDLPGGKVADLTSVDPSQSMTWDGKDSNGQTVPGGIYLYEIDFQGKAITGTVVVAR